ncbi:MAG: ImmA/IrrE family metallo-endopeptidase [Tepidisphaeraceae bacterium]
MAVNPAMLVLARDSRGWTQSDLASVIRVAQATVSRYEIGALPVPDVHRDQIASALNYEPEFFEQPDLLVGLGGDFLYRKRAALSAKSQRRIEAEANIRKIQVTRLLRGSNIVERFPFPAIPLNEVGYRPEVAAQQLRQAFRLPRGPIQNLTRTIENAGAIIFTVDFGTDYVDGTNIRLPGIPPLLYLNKNVQGERHRFNLAHELGHAVMHFATAIGDPESEANTFAQEFLMPKAEIRSDLKNIDITGALRLKPVWGVSIAALIHRAYNLNQIPKSKYQRLFTQLGAAKMRTVEPETLPFERPETFDKMIETHRVKLGFDDFEMRKLLFTESMGEIPVPRVPQLRLAGLFDGFDS